MISYIFNHESDSTKEEVQKRLPKELEKFQLAVPRCSLSLYEVLKKNWDMLPDYKTISPKVLKRLITDVSSSGIPPEFSLKYHTQIGWGLFVAPRRTIDAKKIVGIYTGHVLLASPRKPQDAARLGSDDSYSFRVESDPIYLTKHEYNKLAREQSVRVDRGYQLSKGLEIVVDAAKCGNFTRFINHSINPNLKASCRLAKFAGGSQIIIVFIAKRTIFENEPLSLDYGPGYWKSKGITPNRLLFTEFA